MYALKQTVAPTVDPVTLDNIKKFLGVAHSYDDDLLKLIIGAATTRVEELTNRQLITATWQLTLDGFPVGHFICLPKAPIQSVTTIAYTDSDGDPATFTTFTLDIEKEPGQIYHGLTTFWPATQGIPSAVKVTYVSGYGAEDTDIPDGIQVAVMYAAKHFYDHRDEFEVGTIVAAMPQTTQSLINSYSYGDEFVSYE